MIDAWCRRYRAELGRDYRVVPKRDGQAIRSLPASYTVGDLEALIDAFWTSDDRFIRRVNPTIPVFVSLVGKLVRIFGDGRPPPGRPDDPDGRAEIDELVRRGDCW